MWIDPSSSSQNPISVETALPFSLSLITGSPLTSLHPYTLQQCLEASKALDDVLVLFLKYHDPIGEPLLYAADLRCDEYGACYRGTDNGEHDRDNLPDLAYLSWVLGRGQEGLPRQAIYAEPLDMNKSKVGHSPCTY